MVVEEEEVVEDWKVVLRDAATASAERGGRWCRIASNRWHKHCPTWSDRYRHGGV